MKAVFTLRKKRAFYKAFFFSILLTFPSFGVDKSSSTLSSSIKEKPTLPFCPSWLNSKNVNFLELKKSCNYDRRLLPPCELGFPSLKANKVNTKRSLCTKEWTIIVFIAGDDDILSHYTEEDIGEIFYSKAEDKENHFDLVVEIDFLNREAKRYAFEKTIEEDRIHSIEAKDFIYEGEQNTGDPETLKDFLSWAVESFPSRHYMLIIGGHGDGWASARTNSCHILKGGQCSFEPDETQKEEKSDSSPAMIAQDGGYSSDRNKKTLETFINKETELVTRTGKGIAYDKSHKDWLSITELKQILSHVRNTFLGGAKLDIYAADACLMQQAEVAFELRNQVKYIYGSLPVFPAQGLPYDDILQNFSEKKYTASSKDSEEGLRKLAEDLPQLVSNYYKELENHTEVHKRLAVSVLETKNLEKSFLQSLNTLGEIGLKWINKEKEKELGLLSVQMSFQASLTEVISYKESVYDMEGILYQWIQLLSSTENDFENNEYTKEFIQAIEELRETLKKTIVKSVYGENYNDWRVSGLSIWMPENNMMYKSALPYLARSSLHRYSHTEQHSLRELNEWSSFLKELFSLPTMSN